MRWRHRRRPLTTRRLYQGSTLHQLLWLGINLWEQLNEIVAMTASADGPNWHKVKNKQIFDRMEIYFNVYMKQTIDSVGYIFIQFDHAYKVRSQFSREFYMICGFGKSNRFFGEKVNVQFGFSSSVQQGRHVLPCIRDRVVFLHTRRLRVGVVATTGCIQISLVFVQSHADAFFVELQDLQSINDYWNEDQMRNSICALLTFFNLFVFGLYRFTSHSHQTSSFEQQTA